ncbi:major facilitator superfamily domain-containing protein 6-A-like isoform X2 [Ornithodoros turicata]|uniref:major facilitator superfamily domain-containing protein 6-A-like isoform X2 n=1 Tax=Ornithodoros turicata TaxID=34597 RepID=UPI003138CB7B
MHSFVPLPVGDADLRVKRRAMWRWDELLPRAVNRKLLPLKVHFFLYLAAQACVYSYLAVVGRQNGINAATTAIIFALTPLAAVLLKPVCGYIVDRTQNVTAVILILQLLVVVSHGTLFFSPSIPVPDIRGDLHCSQGHFTYFGDQFQTKESAPCYNATFPIRCTLFCRDIPQEGAVKASIENITGATFEIANVSSVCASLVSKGWTSRSSDTSCALRCSCETGVSNYVSSAEFWMYTVSVVIAFAVTATLFSITDAAVCEVLQDNVNAFGLQRLWGTISWGIVSPFAGFLIDTASTPGRTDYTPGYYMFVMFMVLDMLLIGCMPKLKTAELSSNYFSDLRKIFHGVEIIVFTLWTFIIGALMGVVWSFSTWFLEDIGAPKLLIGLTNSVMSLCVELPFFFFSKNILQAVGHFLSYSLSFVGFAIKFTGYSYLSNPWYVLLIEFAGGAIFPLTYSALTVFAKTAAKPGTSASMLCILGATFEGFGIAAGNMLGGFGIETVGSRLTFRYMGYASLACAVLCTVSCIAIKQRVSASTDTNEESNLTISTKHGNHCTASKAQYCSDEDISGTKTTWAEQNSYGTS